LFGNIIADLKKTNAELIKKLTDKDKYSNLLIEKIQNTSEQRNKIIQEQADLRNKAVKEAEDYVKSLQEQYESQLPEKQKLIEENQNLRKEIEETVQTTMTMKSEIEGQMNSRESKALTMETDYKNDLKTKMEGMTMNAQKYLIENSQLKSEIITYSKKNEELFETVSMFNKEFDKLSNEIEKVIYLMLIHVEKTKYYHSFKR
jgi:chromosome segregation ATPase